MSIDDCNTSLKVKELIQILETIDPEMEVVLRKQSAYIFDIDISESYDPLLDRTVLVLEGL